MPAMHPRHWKWEFRDAVHDGAGGGIECRLVQGGDRGWQESGTWLAFPQAGSAAGAITVVGLIEASQQVQRTHDDWLAACRPGASGDVAACKAAHDVARDALDNLLRTALPDPIGDVFRDWAFVTADREEPRLVLVATADGEQPNARALVGTCLFECLRWFANGAIGLRRLQVPLAQREQPLPRPLPAEHQPLRVLVLLGDLRDPTGWGRHALAAVATLRQLAADLVDRGIGPALEVVVAAAGGAADAVGSGLQVDERITTALELEHLLQHGRITQGADRDYHALVTLGHSDADPGSTATGIRFHWKTGADPESIAASKIAGWCRRSLQFALLLNCKSAALAAEFLVRAEHVLGAQPMLDVRHAGVLAHELFAALIGSAARPEATVAEAARRARAALEEAHAAGWSLLHLAATETDLEFLSRARQIVTKFYQDAYAHEATLYLGRGSGQDFELTEIHVALDIGELVVAGSGGTADTGDDAGGQRDEPNAESEGDAAGDGDVVGGTGRKAHRRKTGVIERRMQVVKFEHLLERGHRRWLLRGEPGGGKTTTLRFCAQRPPSGKLVFYVSLARWAEDVTGAITGESLCAKLTAESIRQELVRIAKARAESGDLIVLLDAYDEVEEQHRDKVHKLFQWFDRNWQRAVVVVTARMNTELPFPVVEPSRREASADGGQVPGGRARGRTGAPPADPLAWRLAEVRALDDRQQQELLGHWFANAGLASAEQLARDAAATLSGCGHRLREMAGNPLLLTLLADRMVQELEQRPGVHDFGWLVQLKRHELLDDAINSYVERAYTKDGSSTPGFKGKSLDRLRTLLRRIAWRMTEHGRRYVDEATLRQWAFEQDADGLDVPTWLEKREWREQDFLTRLRDHAGVFRPEDSLPGARWLFFHRYVQEALAAEYWWFVEIEREPAANRVARVRQRLDVLLRGGPAALDFWLEPLVLLVERLQDGDSLLVGLLGEKATRVVGFRVLQAVERVQPSTVKALLASSCLPAWGKGYEDLPPFGGWVPRAVLLELVAERLPWTDDGRAAIELLSARAQQPDASVAEIGAIVYCLERAGALGRPAKAAGTPAERARAVPEAVRQAVAQIVTQERFGALTEDDVERHFRWTPMPEGANVARKKQGIQTLWPEIPAVTEFEMGSHERPNERPPDVPVSLPSFWMQSTAVTQAQYALFDRSRSAEQPLRPRTNVTWYEAFLFARWLTVQWRRLRGGNWDGMFDLPTEAEREWATRARTSTPSSPATRYWSGNGEPDLRRVGWYRATSGIRLHDVAELEANRFGLHDVHGNSWDWMRDGYRDRLPGGAGPLVEFAVARRVLRGGSYGNDAVNCRAAFRFDLDPFYYWHDVGFRLVCVGVSPQLDR